MSYSMTGHKTPVWESDLQQALLHPAASHAAIIFSALCCCDGKCINTGAEWDTFFLVGDMSYICSNGSNCWAIFTLNHHHQSSRCNYYFPRDLWTWKGFTVTYLLVTGERTFTMLNLSHPSAFGQQNVLLFIQYFKYRGATGCLDFFLTVLMLLESVKFFQCIRSVEMQETIHTTVWSVGSA